MSELLQQILGSLCKPSGWTYAVFWRLKEGSSLTTNRVLTWEQGHFEGADAALGEASLAGVTGLEAAGTGPLSQASGSEGSTSGLQVAYAAMQDEIHGYHNSLIGRVAATDTHRWVYENPRLNSDSPSGVQEFHPASWSQQFAAGIQVVAVIAVSGGVVQMGSCHLKGEDENMMARIRAQFDGMERASASLLFTPGQLPAVGGQTPVPSGQHEHPPSASTSTISTTSTLGSSSSSAASPGSLSSLPPIFSTGGRLPREGMASARMKGEGGRGRAGGGGVVREGMRALGGHGGLGLAGGTREGGGPGGGGNHGGGHGANPSQGSGLEQAWRRVVRAGPEAGGGLGDKVTRRASSSLSRAASSLEEPDVPSEAMTGVQWPGESLSRWGSQGGGDGCGTEKGFSMGGESGAHGDEKAMIGGKGTPLRAHLSVKVEGLEGASPASFLGQPTPLRGEPSLTRADPTRPNSSQLNVTLSPVDHSLPHLVTAGQDTSLQRLRLSPRNAYSNPKLNTNPNPNISPKPKKNTNLNSSPGPKATFDSKPSTTFFPLTGVPLHPGLTLIRQPTEEQLSSPSSSEESRHALPDMLKSAKAREGAAALQSHLWGSPPRPTSHRPPRSINLQGETSRSPTAGGGGTVQSPLQRSSSLPTPEGSPGATQPLSHPSAGLQDPQAPALPTSPSAGATGSLGGSPLGPASSPFLGSPLGGGAHGPGQALVFGSPERGTTNAGSPVYSLMERRDRGRLSRLQRTRSEGNGAMRLAMSGGSIGEGFGGFEALGGGSPGEGRSEGPLLRTSSLNPSPHRLVLQGGSLTLPSQSLSSRSAGLGLDSISPTRGRRGVRLDQMMPAGTAALGGHTRSASVGGSSVLTLESIAAALRMSERGGSPRQEARSDTFQQPQQASGLGQERGSGSGMSQMGLSVEEQLQRLSQSSASGLQQQQQQQMDMGEAVLREKQDEFLRQLQAQQERLGREKQQQQLRYRQRQWEEQQEKAAQQQEAGERSQVALVQQQQHKGQILQRLMQLQQAGLLDQQLELANLLPTQKQAIVQLLQQQQELDSQSQSYRLPSEGALWALLRAEDYELGTAGRGMEEGLKTGMGVGMEGGLGRTLGAASQSEVEAMMGIPTGMDTETAVEARMGAGLGSGLGGSLGGGVGRGLGIDMGGDTGVLGSSRDEGQAPTYGVPLPSPLGTGFHSSIFNSGSLGSDSPFDSQPPLEASRDEAFDAQRDLGSGGMLEPEKPLFGGEAFGMFAETTTAGFLEDSNMMDWQAATGLPEEHPAEAAVPAFLESEAGQLSRFNSESSGQRGDREQEQQGGRGGETAQARGPIRSQSLPSHRRTPSLKRLHEDLGLREETEGFRSRRPSIDLDVTRSYDELLQAEDFDKEWSDFIALVDREESKPGGGGQEGVEDANTQAPGPSPGSMNKVQQQMLNSLLELRSVVPDVSECKISTLLERTLQHVRKLNLSRSPSPSS